VKSLETPGLKYYKIISPSFQRPSKVSKKCRTHVSSVSYSSCFLWSIPFKQGSDDKSHSRITVILEDMKPVQGQMLAAILLDVLLSKQIIGLVIV
jgi:hypothetical protein